MKLELRHLAPYLPYGLRYTFDNHKYWKIDTLIDPTSPKYDFGTLVRAGKEELLYPISVEWDDPKNGLTSGFKFDNINFKPILRPISDLDGKLGWINKMSQEVNHSISFDNGLFSDSMADEFTIEWIPKICFEWLIKNHFDVFWLIPAGLAIDINTITS
jgi:hypothetical protein